MNFAGVADLACFAPREAPCPPWVTPPCGGKCRLAPTDTMRDRRKKPREALARRKKAKRHKAGKL